MWEAKLKKLSRDHLLRELSVIDSASGPNISVNEKNALLFASNDYLGLANHPHLKQAAVEAIKQFGVGAGASRLISGTQMHHDLLEQDLARFTNSEAALTFSSGYATNLGVLPRLVSGEGLILIDRLCHASLIDACRLSRAKLRVFRHNDIEHVRTLLNKRPANQPTILVTEGVFSMDGDLAPLPELAALAQEFEAALLIDDAHGTGVFGATGGGTLEHFGIEEASYILHMGTLSKAVGASGGFMTGKQDFIAYLINTSRPFIFSTAPPPAIAAAARVALHLIQQEPERRAKLWKNRNQMYRGLQNMGCRMPQTQSPILPIMVNDPERAIDMSRHLREKGLYIPAIRPPTVPKGTSRLRVTVTANHSEDQIHSALTIIQQTGQSFKVL